MLACVSWCRGVLEAELQNEAEQHTLSALEQQAIADLVNDFPRVWRDPRTADRDRKRMVRLLLEGVTVLTEEVMMGHVHFKGRAIDTINVVVNHRWRYPPNSLCS
jgi:hypothetical protein